MALKVSIITPVLNGESTIINAIESVIKQDYDNIEHIIIDGNSTDETSLIVKKYTNHIDTFISEPDEGVYDAMNKGIKLATGDIIATLNSDDTYASRYTVKNMVEFIETHGLDAAYGDLMYVSCNNTEKIVRFWKAGEYRKSAFCYGWVLPHPTFFCKREIFERYGYYNPNLRIASDFELLLRFIEKKHIKISYQPEVIVKMRTGGKAYGLTGILCGNLEIISAFRLNDISLSPWFFIRKPILKLSQYFRRPKLYSQMREIEQI